MRRSAARRVTLILVTLLVAAGGFAVPAAADSMPVDHTVSMTEADGTVDVRTQVTVPDGTTAFRITIPDRTEVYATDGFTRVDDRTYEWTRSTDTPTISYRMEGNVTVDRGAGPRHLFAVTDEWAIIRSPNVGLREPGSDVEADERVRVDGPGAAGPHITYLGPHDTRVRDGPQRFRLVVPDAAEMRTTPATALDSLTHASRRIPFGRADDEVFVVVAPTTVEWAATGLQRGDADMWVRDVQPVDSPRNAWVHEYVHTRQDYGVTAATRWTFEGMAEYYAALLPYEAGRISYERFRTKLARGGSDTYEDVVLADPDTWADNEGNYVKGALVWGYLDRRLHADGASSMDSVAAGFGDDELSQAAFLDAIAAAGDAGVRADAEQYTESTAAPPTWGRTTHVEAFGGPLIRHEFEGFAVDGPYRNTSVREPRLVTGETLEASVVVSNDGTDPGEYDVSFRVAGEPVATRRGTLAAGESATLTFRHRFATPGEYELRAGTATATAVVEPPADPTVTDLAVEPTTAARGEGVTIRATVASSAARPANGTVTITVDGRLLATRRVAVADTTTLTATTAFDAAGDHTVTAGSRSVTVTVRDATVTPGTTTPPTGVGGGSGDGDGSGAGSGAGTPSRAPGAGFGMWVAVTALVGAALLLLRRGRSR